MFGLLRHHRLIFEDRRDVGGGVSSFAFRPETPMSARAGQHGILGLSATAMKPFSLASAPEEQRVLIGPLCFGERVQAAHGGASAGGCGHAARSHQQIHA